MFIGSLLLWRDLSSVLINVDGESDSIIVNSYSRCYAVCCFRVERTRRVFPEGSVAASCVLPAFPFNCSRSRLRQIRHRPRLVHGRYLRRVAAGGALAPAQMARSGRPVGTTDGWTEGSRRCSRAPDTVNPPTPPRRYLAPLHRRAGA